ncbi:MAG TPA: hypothetical protein EYG71_05975 [Leucothrix sp.]|nr:hypothetical protein [Leucothrix sp.]
MRLLLFISIFFITFNSGHAIAKSPNVILILLDDFGYNDLDKNGNSGTPTKHLNLLASQGARFTRHYADSTCSPSRVAILTGKFPSRTAQPTAFLGISPETQTLAEILQQADYQTYHIGKWHIGDTLKGAWPSAQGFDHWFGFLNQFLLQDSGNPNQPYSNPSYRDPWLQSDSTPRQKYKGHLTDILTDHTIESINTLSNSEKPWFINLWYFAPHDPIQAADRYTQKYPNSDKGRYYALLNQVDDSIGKIISTLDKKGLSNNTLIVVLSDNGGTNSSTNNNYPFYGKKVTFYEGGVRTPLLIKWPKKIPSGIIIDNAVSEVDVFPTIVGVTTSSPPDDLDGVDLISRFLAPLASKQDIKRPLFWELTSTKYYAYSVLSEDGQWRLMNKELFNLKQDPTGTTNVAKQHPDKVKELTQDFFAWQQAATVADVKFSRKTLSSGILSGDSFHRSPGAGGFTFALGITPNSLSDTPEAIVTQPKMWAITQSSNSLKVTIGEVVLKIPPLKVNQCSTLVLSAYYSPAKLSPEKRTALYQLYVDGHLALEHEQPLYKSLPSHYEIPTLIGYSNTSADFSGRLSNPKILNMYLGTDTHHGSASGKLSLPATAHPISTSLLLDKINKELCPNNSSADTNNKKGGGGLPLPLIMTLLFIFYFKKNILIVR